MSKGRILVVEDNPDNQQLVTWILEDEAYDVTCASSAEDGLRLLKNHQYKAVLMDISLPGMDGKEATKVIRTMDGLQALPIFALTAHAQQAELDSIRQCGVTAILAKPINEVQLIEYLKGVGHA